MPIISSVTQSDCSGAGHETKIRELLAAQFGVDAASIHADDHIIERFRADSLELLEVCLSLNKLFGIEIGPQNLKTIETVGDVYRLVAQLLLDPQGVREVLPALTKEMVLSRLAAVRVMK